MTARAEVSSSVLIRAAPTDVWAYLTSWRRQGEWIPLTDVVPLDGAGDRVGARVVARTGVGRIGFDDPMTVTDWEPPRHLGVRHTGRVVRGEATALVEPVGTATRLTWSERLEVPGGRLGALGWRLARPLTQRVFDATLHRLRRRLETAG